MDLEAKLTSDYIQPYADKPITFISEYKYMLEVIMEFLETQGADKMQDVSDNIIENYWD